MSNFLTEGYGAVVISDASDFEKVEAFCRDNGIDYTAIYSSTLHGMGCCPRCGDSEFWSPWDQHCSHCG